MCTGTVFNLKFCGASTVIVVRDYCIILCTLTINKIYDSVI